MTKEESKILHALETRVRQLIMEYKALEQENQELYELVDEKELAIAELKEKNERLQEELKNITTAKIIEVSADDVATAKSRISKLIKEIDRCIALINV